MSYDIENLLDVNLDLEFEGVLEAKCKEVLGIDPITGLRDPNNKVSPVLVKLLSNLVTGNGGMFMELHDNPSAKQRDFEIGYAIGYSHSGNYRFALNGPKAVVEYKRTPNGDYSINLYSPGGRDSWYLAGIAVPLIYWSDVYSKRWLTVYNDYITYTGDDWSIADWTPFIDILSSALRTLNVVDSSTGIHDGTPVTRDLVRMWGNNAWPYEVDKYGFNNLGMPPQVTKVPLDVYNANGIAMPDPSANMGNWHINNAREMTELIPDMLDGTQTLTIEREGSAKPDPEAVVGKTHKYIGPNGILGLRYAEQKKHMIFIGPTGTAKTQLALGINEELGTEYVLFTGTEATETHELLGTWSIGATGVPEWNDGPLVEAMRRGICFVLDELNRLRAVVQTALLSAMCGAMEVKIAHKNNEVVKAEEGFYVIACQNMGTGYAVFGQDSALFDRFERQIIFPYPESELRELEILLDIVPEIDTESLTEHAKVACSMARESRELYESGELGAISTRKLLEWMRELVWNKQQGLGDSLEDASINTVAIDVCGLMPSGGALDEDNWNRFKDLLSLKQGGR